jgi:hypothetical protein
MMNSYKPAAAAHCLAERRIVMAGDSMVRETFWAMVRTLNSSLVPSTREKHSDIHITLDRIRLDFYWDPYLNGTGIDAVFNFPEDVTRPVMSVLGSGLWYAKNIGAEGFPLWKQMIDDVATLSQDLQRQGQATADLLIILPVLEPAWNQLHESRQSITPENLERMNSYLHALSTARHVNVAFAFEEMLLSSSAEVTHVRDGLHLVDAVTAAQSQILLNIHCNDRLEKKFPFDKTCCYKYPAPNIFQLTFFATVLLLLPILYRFQSDRLKRFVPTETTFSALFTFGLVLVYAYYTDRTHLFGKEHKQFSLEQFWFLVIITVVIGYFTTTTSETPQSFLSRDQTDEWKGWMQILILIYHYLGASKVPWIYNWIRVLVAMYLFMTGYGHTVFFYKKADFGFKRVVSVLVRLNLLNVVLAYSMDTDYLFYYFSPLVSFWFGVVWLTMRISQERNSDIRFLGAKIIVSAIIVTTFTKTPGILEGVFGLLQTVARIHWDPVEWRFRVGLDIWIVYIGMITALTFLKINEYNFTASPKWQYTRNATIASSLIILPVFLLFEATRESKFVYNKYHPYISFLPILAFVVLRNASTTLRNSHSAAFAFIGRCSLETFILQFHIWLGGDTKGILVVIGPERWRWLSFVLGTVLFVFISWKVSVVTGTITEWVMGSQKKIAPLSVPVVVFTAASVEDGEKGEEIEMIEKTESPTSQALQVSQALEVSEPSQEESLPSEASEEALLPAPVTASQTLTFTEKLVRVLEIYWQDLRIRTAIIFLTLWILNLVPSHPTI